MTKRTRRPHFIVFSFSGLNTLWLGCYGNTSVSTPGLDRLALRSVVFDHYYTNTSRTDLLYSSFLHGVCPVSSTVPSGSLDEASSLPSQLASQGYRTVLLTDDDYTTIGRSGEFFDEVVEMEQEDSSSEPVESYEETRFCRYFEEAIRILSESVEDDSETPLFLWCRFKGFFGPWDFPQEERLAQREDEEDPEPYAGTEVPFWEEQGPTCSKDDYRLRPEVVRDHDAILSFLQTWKAGLAVLDMAVNDFLDFLNETELDQNAVFVFTSEQGFPLGEHGRVGQDLVSASNMPHLLYPEEFHCPLMIHLPDFNELAFRTPLLCGPTDLYSILVRFVSDDYSESQNEVSFLQAVLEEKETFHDHLLFVEDGADSINRCVVTEHWLLRQTSFTVTAGKKTDGVYGGVPVYYEVYALPDDRFCVNDVSSRTEQEQGELLALMTN